jgi:PAS domain S-box-containing protein
MESKKGRGSLASRYLAALLAPAAIAGGMQVTWPFFQAETDSPYLLAVIFCAWYGGLGPGLLSVVISVLLTDFLLESYFFFWPPRFPKGVDLVRLLPFAGVGSFICVMSELMHRERRRAEINLESAKRAERSLRDNEHFANQIAELTPVVINVFDLATRRNVYISPDVVNLLGYTPTEILEMEDSFSVLWHPEDIPLANENLALLKHARDGEIAEFECRMRRRDGEWRWVASRIMPFKRDEHGAVQIITASLDITARKLTQEALRERSEVLQAIFDHNPVMFCFIDQTGRIKLANREFERVFGWTLAEIQGHPDIFAEFYPDLDYRAGVLAFIRESTGKFAEFQTRTRGGAVIPTSFANVLLADGTSIGIGLDITERKRAEDALRKQNEILQKIFDNIPVMINFTDSDGRIILVNREWQQTLGWSPDEVRNEDLDVFSECYPDPKYRQEVMEFVKTATGEWVDFRTRTRDGRVIDTSWARVRLSDGTTIGIGQDITQRKRAEEQIRATSEQLRALSASLQAAREEEGTRIAREIHDELGAALTSLRWDLESFDKVISESGDRSKLQVLRERIAAMLRLTETTISTVRRISSELRPSVLDDLGLAAAIEWQVQQFQARTGIICRCDCSLENIDLSREQSTAVFRIFQEALTNILRHAQATTVDTTMKAEAGEFVLEIIDNGRGITENEKSGLQSLGLLGMQERAHLIGGKINVTGVEGKGTVITVQIPISG